MIQFSSHIPQEFLSVDSRGVHDLLGGPTLFFVKGQKEPPLFLSCLMHGNEYTGLIVLQRLIKKYQNNWPRSVYIFIGNTIAAKSGKRHLDDQIDFNRIWTKGELPEHQMAQDVLKKIYESGLFASVDIHNNSGRNPVYVIIKNKDLRTLNLATMFGDVIFYYPSQCGTLTEVLTQKYPAITIEAAMPGDPTGIEQTYNFIEKLLTLEQIPTTKNVSEKVTLINAAGVLKIPQAAKVSVGDNSGDIWFEKDYDLMNFKEQMPGTVLGHYKNNHRLSQLTLSGTELKEDFLRYEDGNIVVNKPFLPTMLTENASIIKSESVGYITQKMNVTEF